MPQFIIIVLIVLSLGTIVGLGQDNSIDTSIESSGFPAQIETSVLDPLDLLDDGDVNSDSDDYLISPSSSENLEDFYLEVEDRKNGADDLQSRTEDLNWEINRLRRNTDWYNADDFSSKLKKLQWEAEELSSDSADLGADDTASNLDEAAYKLRRLRSEIEWEPSYFYQEREDEVYSRLKRSEWDTEDASSSLEDFSSSLDDFDF